MKSEHANLAASPAATEGPRGATPIPVGAHPAWTQGLSGRFRVADLGRIDYASGTAVQARLRDEVIAAREQGSGCARPSGWLLLLEHDPPVITVSHRPTARTNLTATVEALQRAGVEVAETDRGGDITYHGPGQLVAYPILDLNALGLGLHDYMRLLERAVIAACRRFGVDAHRDVCATGVWVGGATDGERRAESGQVCGAGVAPGGRKICAMGVRVRKWVTTHGLALNVTTNLAHFDLIVPCGLAGRAVTSLERELGGACPSMDDVKRALAEALDAEIGGLAPRGASGEAGSA